MKKFKIVHLTTSLKIGGAETILVDLIRNLDDDLFENHVIYFYDGPNIEKLQKLGVKTYKINGLICKYDPVFVIRLFFLIKKLKPNCIHSLLWSANILGTIAAYLLKIPIACALHLATNFEASGENTFFRNTLDKVILPKSNALIAVSDSMVNDLKKNNRWIPFEKLKVIKNGIDIENIETHKVYQSHNKSDYKIYEDTFVIGTVGRFIPRKNQQMLISSFAKLSKDYENIHLMLVGYGPMEDDLRRKTKEFGISNKVTFIKTDRAYEFYSLFNCFVLTSTQESFGLVTLEAMLFELPCIVTNSDLNHEIITDGINGCLIKHGDVESLYLKLKKMYEDKNERVFLGSNAKRNIYENFDIKKMVSHYSALFIELDRKIHC